MCYDLSSRKMIISRHVQFDEHNFPFLKLNNSISTYEFLDLGLNLFFLNQPGHIPAQTQQYQWPNLKYQLPLHLLITQH